MIRIRNIPVRANDWVGKTHNRWPQVGPALFVASALYFFAQIIVAWVYKPPPYSLVRNNISDLGNTKCGVNVCSPRHLVMNVAFFLLGVVMVFGSWLLSHEFTEKRGHEKGEQNAACIGFSLMALGGIGAMLVGIFPENTNSTMHVLGAGLAIGAGNLGIFIIAAVIDLPEAMRRYMLLFSTISATALVLFANNKFFGIGGGTMERVAAYPETIWLITFGLYIWRFNRKWLPHKML
jgi:hypothetical membrane protein